jgi:hypothetical protein
VLVAAGALLNRDEAVERMEVLDEHIGAVRHEVVPGGPTLGHLGVAHLSELVVLGVPVGADDPAIADVIGLVAELALARRDHGPLPGPGGAGAALLVADRRLLDDANVLVVTGAGDADVEGVVPLLVHELVGGRGRPQHVRLDALAEQRHRVLLDIIDGAVVVGPGEVGFDIGDVVGERLAGCEVFDLKRVLAAADGIERVGEQAIVLADCPVADREEAVALRHRRLVEHHLLFRFQRAGLAGEHRIVLPRLEACIIPVTAVADRDGGIVLLDVADDLLEQLILQRLGRSEHRVGVGVLRRQVSEHVRILPRVIAQPIIWIDAVLRAFDGVGLLRNRRRRRRRLRRGQSRKCGNTRRQEKPLHLNSPPKPTLRRSSPILLRRSRECQALRLS